MEIVLIIISAIIIQHILNITSDKIDYEYSSTNKILAIGINVSLWLISFMNFGNSATFWVIAISESILISSSFIDLRYKEIPDSYNFLLAVLGVIFIFIYKPYYQELLLGGVIAFSLFFVIMIFTGAMGGGDVKMAGALGLFMGTMLISRFIVYSFMFGALVGAFLLVSKKMKKDDVFPFGPCIAISAIYIFINLL